MQVEDAIKAFPLISLGGNANEMVSGREYGLAALDESKVVGYITIWPKTNDLPHDIRHIEVLEDYQRKGIGTELMNRALDYLRKKEVHEVQTLMTNNQGLFFEKFGFRGDDTNMWGMMYLRLN